MRLPRIPPALMAVAATVAACGAIGVSAAGAAPSDPILVYSGNTSMAPSQTYAGVATASGRSISSTTVMPGSLAGNACVLLNLNQATFNGTQVTTLSAYLSGGGTVIMIGENDNYVNNAPFRALATGLGSSMQIQNNALDGGFRDTFNIDSDPLTLDVFAINYAATATVTFSSPARSLVRTSGGGDTMIAAEAIGAGTLVALGDANAFTSPTGDAGILVANMCGNRRTTTTAMACTPDTALVGVTVSCEATVTDSQSGTAVTPTGDVTLSRGGAGSGTYSANTCTLAPSGTLGTATCSVTYVATSQGTQSLTATYGGTTQSRGSTGSDPYIATLPAAPAPTSGTSAGAAGAVQTLQVTIPSGGSVSLLDGGQAATTVTVAGEGTYVLNATTGLITFTPLAGFAGTARAVSFRVTDAFGQSTVATFTPTVAAAPAGATPVATPTATPAPATPAPAAKVCASRRAMMIHCAVRRGTTLRSLEVTMTGQKLRRLRPGTRRTMANLRGYAPATVTVNVTARTTTGQTLTGKRTYRTCDPRTLSPKLRTVALQARA